MKDVVKTGSKDASAAKRRNSGGREGGIAGYCAVAFVFVSFVGLMLCLTVFFKVKTVEVNGVTLYREDQIVGVGGIISNENLVRTDTKLIEKRLKDNLVFIETAEVEKKYPSTIIINVTEAVKAADMLLDNGKYCTVSETGRVLELANASQTGGIPVIKGFELANEKAGGELESKDKNKLRIYKDMMKIISAISFEHIGQIDLSDRSGITMLYDDRITLELGSSVDLDYKLNYFKAVIDNKLTGGFRGRLVYNGADSGISAIPEGAGIKNDDSSDPDKQTDGNGENGTGIDPNTQTDPNAAAVPGTTTDPNAAAVPGTTTDPNAQAVPGANTDANNNANNNGQIPAGVEEYGYMKNRQGQQNGQDGQNQQNGQSGQNGQDGQNQQNGQSGQNGQNDQTQQGNYTDPNIYSNGNNGYDPNTGNNNGYDPNAGYGNNGYDPNAGYGNNGYTDPNANGNNYQYYYQP